jgi:hypothetical protein
MTIPSTQDLPSPGRAGRLTGAWVEAVDGQGSVLYRRMLREPPAGVEVFHRDGSISRISVENDQYSMDLLIPDLPEIEAIHLYVEEPTPRPQAKDQWAPRPVAVIAARDDKPRQRSKQGR